MRYQLLSCELLLLLSSSVVRADSPSPQRLAQGYSHVDVDSLLGGSTQLNARLAASDGASCGIAQKACNGGCIPSLGTCCEGQNGWCSTTEVCVEGGCCPIGKICSDDPSGCIGSLVSCGTDGSCIPSGKICCAETGYYCDPGETCKFEDGINFCGKGDDTSATTTQALPTITSSGAKASTTETATTANADTTTASSAGTSDSSSASTTTEESSTSGTESASQTTESGNNNGGSSMLQMTGSALMVVGLSFFHLVF